MHISMLMTPEPVTVHADDSLDDAIALMDKHYFRHLPVVSSETIAGLLSDRDVLLATGWLPSSERSFSGEEASGRPRFVREIMKSSVTCIRPDELSRAAAKLMLDQQIGALPVVNDGRLVGIVTQSDLVKAFRDLCRRRDNPGHWDRKVAHCMRKHVITANPEDVLEDAITFCTKYHIRHLPVVQDGALLGIVSDRDLRRALGLELIADAKAQQEGRLQVESQPVSAVMTRGVVTIDPEAPLSWAAALMLDNRFSALPVEQGGKLVAIITQADILKHYAAVA